MSTSPQVALLGQSARRASPPRLHVERAAEQPLVRLAAFAALGLYGVLRWSSLLSGGAGSRLLALLALAVLLAAGGLVTRGRLLPAIGAILAALAALAIAGVPLAWVVHLRVAVTARAIGDGLAALPRTSVPYTGINQWVRTVIVLEQACSCSTPRRCWRSRHGRSATCAAPALRCRWWRWRRFRRRSSARRSRTSTGWCCSGCSRRSCGASGSGVILASALALCAVAAVAATAAAPAIDPRKPWLNPLTLAGGLAPTQLEAFDWSGNLTARFIGRERIERCSRSRLPRGKYWKAENLDVFNGTGWALGSVLEGGNPLSTVSAANINRWTQTLHVTVGAMSTTDVISAGEVIYTPGDAAGRPEPGTRSTATQIGPGDSYSIRVYAPNPSAAQLASAGDRYPQGLLPGYLSIQVPTAGSPASAA